MHLAYPAVLAVLHLLGKDQLLVIALSQAGPLRV